MENIDTYSNTVNEKKESNSDVQKLLSQPYKYGFTTDVEVEESVSYTHLTLPTIYSV